MKFKVGDVVKTHFSNSQSEWNDKTAVVTDVEASSVWPYSIKFTYPVVSNGNFYFTLKCVAESELELLESGPDFIDGETVQVMMDFKIVSESDDDVFVAIPNTRTTIDDVACFGVSKEYVKKTA